MKRKLIAVLLSLALLASAVFCVGAAVFLDTDGHWAASYIDEASSRGLFSGTGGGYFAPDAVMTRGMFVTAMARTAGVAPEDWDPAFLAECFTDVQIDAYYAPFVAWAVTVGAANGIGDGKFAPDAPVSREQMACFVRSLMDSSTGSSTLVQEQERPPLPEEFQRKAFDPAPRGTRDETNTNTTDIELPPDNFAEESVQFSDADRIAPWARESVERLKDSGLFSGAPDGNGGFAFMPQKTATRAEGAVVFCKLQDLLQDMPVTEPIAVSNLVLNQDAVTIEAGQTLEMAAMVFPMDATNPHIFWYSTNIEVFSVDAGGCITAIAEGEAELRARASNGLEVCCKVTVEAAPEPTYTPAEGVYAPDSWYEKCLLIFGEPLDDPRLAYADGNEAKQHMTTITVLTWDIDANGEKYTRKFFLEVHENVAPIVAQIFEDIYALPEQVPIHSLGGYRWDGKCEHSIGLAIDINPMENYYCTKDGKAVVGKYFKPGEDPYSIPVMGAVDQIFASYGFTRGIYWRGNYLDYMHYSYFGT